MLIALTWIGALIFHSAGCELWWQNKVTPSYSWLQLPLLWPAVPQMKVRNYTGKEFPKNCVPSPLFWGQCPTICWYTSSSVKFTFLKAVVGVLSTSCVNRCLLVKSMWIFPLASLMEMYFVNLGKSSIGVIDD